VDELKIALVKVSAAGLALDAAVPVSAFEGWDADPLQLSPVCVAGTLKEAGGTYLFEGRVSGTFVRACDRCLVEVRVPYEAEVFWTFEEGPGSELAVEEMDQSDMEGEGDSGVFIFQGGVLDLLPCVWEEVVLAYPARFVPCEDCPELEFECKVEEFEPLSSTQQGSGDEEPRNTGFAGLADMFPDLKPRKSED
jgi:uncharacterized metal-binding protein YceD (DUF177 family)